MSSVDDRVWVLSLNATDSHSVGSEDSDISVFTPGGVPLVLHGPVGNSIFLTIPDEGDSVIELFASTVLIIENTSLIVLEGSLVGLETDGDRLLQNGSLESVLISGVDEVSIIKSDNSSVHIIVALGSSPHIELIISFQCNGGAHSVGVSANDESTTAAGIAQFVRAVQELLLGERKEFSSLQEVSTLDSTSG